MIRDLNKNYSQKEIDQMMDLNPGSLSKMGGSSYYMNEFDLEDRDIDPNLIPREMNIHFIQMDDGIIMGFDEMIPYEEKDFNSEWILKYDPWDDKGLYLQDYPLLDEILQILKEEGIDNHHRLKSN